MTDKLSLRERVVEWILRIVEWAIYRAPRKWIELAFWRVFIEAVPNDDERDWEKFSVAEVMERWWSINA